MSRSAEPSATPGPPADLDLDLDLLAPEAVPGVRVLPVAHDRVESALVVRAVLAALEPAAVAVELPTTVAEQAGRAADRLPLVSVVLSEDDDVSAHGGDALAWICAPGDPFAEALRWAGEHGARRVFVDPDLPYAERHDDPLPDPWAVWELGAAGYFARLAEAVGGGAGEGRAGADRQREAGMAYHVQRALEEMRAAAGGGPAPGADAPRDGGRPATGDASRLGRPGAEVLVLVGAAHAVPLAAALARPAAAPLARVRRSRVDLVHLHPESLTGLLTDAPLAHAVFEHLRTAPGAPGPAATTAAAAPDPADDPAPPPDLEATVARRLSLLRGGFTVHTREEEGWGSDRARRVVEYAASRAGRRLPGTAVSGPDRAALTRAVWQVGSRSWREQARQEAAPWQRRIFFDYGRRYARTTGQLVPGLYAWVVAARGVGDDNLAWEVFETARAYPWQQETADDLATARLDGEDLDLGTRRVRFRRRFFRVKQRWQRVPVRRHPSPADPEEWLRGFDGQGLCSYPPEDVVIEDYGRFLRRKAGSVVAAERERVEPFSTSLLDGVDVRETLRHLDDGRVWVREAGRWPGEAGAVVVIFDRDPENEYPYLMTWQGEHDDESDMAFYASHPGDQVVGPGILRATYGGFLMTYPPGRMFDVWQDPDYRFFGDKPEVLLAAAVDYSREKLIAHVAAAPPSGRLRHHAAAQGKRIVHVPIGALSPRVLDKLRVVHILVGRDKREIAGEYVW